MCGIAAIVGFTEEGRGKFNRIETCAQLLKHRGPDNQRFIIEKNFAFAHARLSIIDLSEQSNQPFISQDKRFTIIYNGEIFNYKALREDLKQKGHIFYTEGDVEVLLNLYKQYDKEALQKINGFFAFVIYDKQADIFFAARDRFGVKPFYYYCDKDYFACASELRVLKHITDCKTIDKSALYTYLQLTYTPEKTCILSGTQKLEPGTFLFIENKKLTKEKYYSVNISASYSETKNANKTFLELLESSVEARMVSDVPVACFLSGGIDSSVITALASKQNKNLQTFSVGFKGNTHFDESVYAEIVAKKYKTNHQTFYFTGSEAENEIENFFNSIDEPFADSSAFNVFMLCKKTKSHAKVVLSGDGADELFAGYNKHRAEWMIRHQKTKTAFIKNSGALSKLFPSSRNGKITDKIRQLQRFSAGAKLNATERYWRWASFYGEKKVANLLKLNSAEKKKADELKNAYTGLISDDYNSVLLSDTNLVLPSDMLVKVDRMSMAHGLEVRNPFLDHRLVKFAFLLESKYKIDGKTQKKIIKESCAHLLPDEILHRKKHGFETPVQQWLRGVLKSKVHELLLNEDFITHQNLFDFAELKKITAKALSNNPGDTTSVVWALLVFNHWYKKHIL
ncbi:MAG TPA: asparagine synthase (glutamine-hydrolyzing) [Bacteroidia bacterium]|jgi:asparagine synthase (glutamine-hydrolysing)|nr:asparagine synthase (glutamine-hydrolyzing) [Bacteroidia bacterium]